MGRTRNQVRKATEDALSSSCPGSDPVGTSQLPATSTDDERNLAMASTQSRTATGKRKATVRYARPTAANRPRGQGPSKRRRTVKIIDEDEEIDGGHADEIVQNNEVDKSEAADQSGFVGTGTIILDKKAVQKQDWSEAGGEVNAVNSGCDVAEGIESKGRSCWKRDNLKIANRVEIAAAATGGEVRGGKDVDEKVARGRDGSGLEVNCLGYGVEAVSLETITYPDDFLIEGGNKTAFKYELLSGQRLPVNYYDIFHASMPRFVNEVVLNVASDRILRNEECKMEAGWIWVHETDVVAEALTGHDPARRFTNSRREQFLSSSVLFVPMQTNASAHWSLLVIFNMKSLLDSVLNVKPPVRGRLPRAELNEEQPKPFALHFDSFRSSGHKSLCQKVVSMFSNCLADVWKKKNSDRWRLTNFSLFVRPFVSRSLKVLSANVEQQEDAYTCGWRVLDGVQFIAKQKDTVVRNIERISKENVGSEYAAIATRTLRFLKEESASSVPSTPLLLYRAHLLLDEICCSAFDTDPSNINDVMVSFFDFKEKEDGLGSANRKKKLQKQKFDDLYSAAASEMEKRNLMSRTRGKKRSSIPKSAQPNNCESIARYLINFPTGSQYACFLYYTRYNYPTSILLCTSLNMLVTKKPRAFGNEIDSFSSRVLKSKRVLYQMAMFLD